MDPLEAIRRAQATRLVNEDGDEFEFELAPAVPPGDIERLADEVGVPLPRDLRALLERASGIESGPLATIDFTGRACRLELRRLSPRDSRLRGMGSATSGFST
jgi:hypothetical protein